MCRIMSQSENKKTARGSIGVENSSAALRFRLPRRCGTLVKKEWESAKRLPYSWPSDSLQCSPVNCPIKHNFLQMAPTKIGRKCVLLIVILLLAGPSLLIRWPDRYSSPGRPFVQQRAVPFPAAGCRRCSNAEKRERKHPFGAASGVLFLRPVLVWFGY